MKEAFIDASHLVHVLPKKGLALLLEAMETGSIVVQDTKAFNILQEAKIHRRIRDEIKAEESKRCAIDLQLEKWKIHMLPSWRHGIFYHSSKHVKIGKVVAAITVYLRFAPGERPREFSLVTVEKQFPIGQQNARKVVTGKLYDTEGIWVKNIFKETRRAYPDHPIDWDAELANASNITEEVIYEFYHKEGENANLPMVEKPIKIRDLKAVSGLLEWTPNFLRSSDDTTPKLRVMFNRSRSFENQVLSKVSSKEAREAIYKQVRIVTASAHQWMAEQSQVKPLTVDTSTDGIVKMELGSPMTKMRKVTTSQEAEHSMSRESSQVEQVIDLTNIGNSSDEEMVFEAAVAHPVKVKSEPLEDDDVFKGLVDHDDNKGGDDDDENEDDEEFPGHIEMPDSDNSDFGAEGDQDLDQLEMQDIYHQQQRNRNTGQVSEIELMQVKAETEDIEDTVDQKTHQMSLETEDSFTPLSTGDNKRPFHPVKMWK